MTPVMVEDRDLSTPGLVDETARKIDAYVNFVTSGQLTQHDPQARSASIRVQYNVLDDPEQSPALMRVLSAATAMFADHGIEFFVRHFNLPIGGHSESGVND